MATETLVAEERVRTGKNLVKKVRAEGNIPAVIYGDEKEPKSVKVSRAEIERIYRMDSGRNTIIELKIGDNAAETVISHDLDRHPITGELVHVDFFRVNEKNKIRTNVPLDYTGTPRGVKMGGVFIHHLSSVAIESLPGDIPVKIAIDISDMGLGKALKVSDINPGAGVEIVTPHDLTAAAVDVPRGISASEEDAAEEAPAAEGNAAPAEA